MDTSGNSVLRLSKRHCDPWPAFLPGPKISVSSLMPMFPRTPRWSKTWTYKWVSLACSALLHFCAATTLWTASPAKGLELCLNLCLLSDPMERHCCAQHSSGAGTEGLPSRLKSSPSYSVHLLKLYLVIISLMAINVFSLDLGRLPSGSRDICKKMLCRSLILGDAVGYFTSTHC